MSERSDEIGQWVALAIFAVLLAVGGWPHDILAQGASGQTATPVASPGWWPSDAPIIGAFIGASIAALVARWIAKEYTGRVKRIEATLEFSKRFHELVWRQRDLNREYEKDRRPAQNTSTTLVPAEAANVPPATVAAASAAAATTIVDNPDGKAWWWQFFDLLLHEFDFWQEGYVREERFMEWMIWRWYDSHPRTDTNEPLWTTCGMNYIEGWIKWQSHPAHGNRLGELLNRIHCADHPNQVPDIVNGFRGITKHGDYSGSKGLRDDVKKNRIRVEDGRYIELASNKTFEVKDNQIKNKT